MALATGTTEFVDVTTASQFIPELWSSSAIVARQAQLVFAKLVDLSYKKEMKFGDTLHIPNVANLTSRTKTANTAITYETDTGTTTDITVSTHEYAAMAVEDIVKIQANQDLMARYSGKLGYALGLAVDDVLAGLADDVTQNVGTLLVPLSFADLKRARQYLDDAEAPMDDRFLVVSPAEESNMLDLDQLVNRDYVMSNASGNTTKPDRGYLGTFMETTVYKSTNVEGTNAAGHDCVMFQREWAALVMQQEPRTYTQFDIDYIVDKVAMTQLYGTKEIRATSAVWCKAA